MAPFSFWKFVKDQRSEVPLTKKDLTGKTIIVVGANTGLGLEASRHLASMNPGRLILACRNVQKGEAALKEIEKTTGCKTLEVWQVDLTDFASIKAFADRFEREGGGRLDALLENAGVQVPLFEETKDGWETTIQTNHLGTALLALLLLPTLSKSPSDDSFPRIAIVASEVHSFIKRLKEGESDHVLNKLNNKEYSTPKVMGDRYFVSKLLNVFFVRALASRLPVDTTIAVDAVNPGFCHSEFSRHATGTIAFMFWLMKLLFARSTEAGSRTLVHAAIGGTRKELQGRYLSTCRVDEESDYVLSEEGQKMEDRLWRETIGVLQGVDPRVKDIVAQYLKST